MEYNRLKLNTYDISKILTKEELSDLKTEKFSKGNVLYYMDNIQLFFIKKGKAKVIIYEQGREFILYYLEKNNMHILSESFAVEFTEDSEIYIINAKNFPKQFKNINFCNMILSAMVYGSLVDKQIIKELVFETSKRRIVSFLLDAAHSYGLKCEDGICVSIDISITELANFVGANRQTTSTIFNQLIKEDLLEKKSNKQILIKNFKKLKEYILSCPEGH